VEEGEIKWREKNGWKREQRGARMNAGEHKRAPVATTAAATTAIATATA
jgi:hypothetical protein